MIRIVTDSAADLTAAELNAPGVFVVPLSVTFADGTKTPIDVSIDEARNKAFLQLNTKGGAKLIEMVANG